MDLAFALVDRGGPGRTEAAVRAVQTNIPAMGTRTITGGGRIMFDLIRGGGASLHMQGCMCLREHIHRAGCV